MTYPVYEADSDTTNDPSAVVAFVEFVRVDTFVTIALLPPSSVTMIASVPCRITLDIVTVVAAVGVAKVPAV